MILIQVAKLDMRSIMTTYIRGVEKKDYRVIINFKFLGIGDRRKER